MAGESYHALALLEGCTEANECRRLAEYLRGERELDEVGYEDVFYPLRCHHRDGLTLTITTESGAIVDLTWGSGDFIYRSWRDAPGAVPIDRPDAVYEGLQRGQFADVDFIVDEGVQEADHA